MAPLYCFIVLYVGVVNYCFTVLLSQNKCVWKMLQANYYFSTFKMVQTIILNMIRFVQVFVHFVFKALFEKAYFTTLGPSGVSPGASADPRNIYLFFFLYKRECNLSKQWKYWMYIGCKSKHICCSSWYFGLKPS